MKNRFIPGFLLAATLGMASAAASADTVRIGIEGAYPPFNTVTASGQLEGFDVDIAKALCTAMKAECTLVAQDWDGMIPALMARKFDAVVSSMVDTPERAKQVDFTKPYYRTMLAVAVAKDSDIKDTQPASFKGKTLGAQSSTTQSQYAEDVYGKAGAEIRLYPTPDEAGSDLIVGRLDGVVHDKYPLVEWMNKHSENCCRLLGDIPGTEGDTSIAVRKGDDALRERFNTAIQTIREQGVYQKISQRYFGMDIY